MHHSTEQLDRLWLALKSADDSMRQEILDRYTSVRMPGVYPSILCDDGEVQKLSIPIPDHPGRHVYARKPGGIWSEEH